MQLSPLTNMRALNLKHIGSLNALFTAIAEALHL